MKKPAATKSTKSTATVKRVSARATVGRPAGGIRTAKRAAPEATATVPVWVLEGVVALLNQILEMQGATMRAANRTHLRAVIQVLRKYTRTPRS